MLGKRRELFIDLDAIRRAPNRATCSDRPSRWPDLC
jgi:hypothetical protein